MMHDELEELLGAYALHATTAEESQRIDAHLATCPRCRSEVAAHEEVAAMLGTTLSEAPPGLWEKIAASLPEEGSEGAQGASRSRGLAPPVLTPGLRNSTTGRDTGTEGTAPTGAISSLDRERDEARQRKQGPKAGRGQRFAMLGAGAVAAAVIAFLGVQVVQLNSQVHNLDQSVGAARVLDGPHLTVQLSSPRHRPAATVVVSPSGTAYWLSSSLPALSSDHTYQMWGLVHDKPVSLGLLGPRPGPVSSFRVEADVTQLMVTAEPRGGTPLPTTAVLAQGYVHSA
jgi:anti-sigma-K factor RskA